MEVSSGSTSRNIISCLGQDIFVQINRILTKFCPWKLRVPVVMTHRVVQPVIKIRLNFSPKFQKWVTWPSTPVLWVLCHAWTGT